MQWNRRGILLGCCAAVCGAILMAAAASAPAMAQMSMGGDGKKLPSPPAKAEVTLSGKTVTINYNTPSMRGRKIFGGLVPYGHWWRTGANPATSLMTTTDLLIGDTKVPTGKYTIYTLPGEREWKLIINKQTGQWGTEYDQSQDLARIPMMVGKLPAPQEVFSISFEKTSGAKTQLHLKWETTDVWVPVMAQ